MSEINFFKEGISFRLDEQEQLKKWIRKVVTRNEFRLSVINFIFCTDRYLRRINKQYLQHDYNTDVVTFDNSVEKRVIIGDIFISIERVRENSKLFSTSFKDELRRVMVHGVLHLLGYDDKTQKEKEKIHRAEDLWLGKY
jgi:rRNA maturation RNase YbeY